MKNEKIAFLLLVLAAGIPASTMAQSGLEMTKELSKDKTATEELFKKDFEPLEWKALGDEIDTGPAATEPPAGVSTLSPNPEPYQAQDGPLTLLNCGKSGISIQTFNSNDGLMWVPFQTVNVGSQQRSGLRCATPGCKLHIGGLRTGTISGYQVYVNGHVRATNKAAMDKGCSVYS